MKKELIAIKANEVAHVDEVQALAIYASLNALASLKKVENPLDLLYGLSRVSGVTDSPKSKDMDEVLVAYDLSRESTYYFAVGFTSEAGEEGPRHYYNYIEGYLEHDGRSPETITRFNAGSFKVEEEKEKTSL